jgi:trimeric autotransporter adhesin
VISTKLLLFAGLASAQTATTYFIQTIAGGDQVGDGGPATSALLSQAEGVAVDSKGNVYVADADDNRVRVIATNGIIQTFAGTGISGFSGDGGPAASAQLSHPYGLAIDRLDNLYIADLGNARIRVVTPAGTIATFAGGGSIAPGGSGDGGPATSAQLIAPRNVVAGVDGSIYISDFGANSVLSVSPAGTITTAAGNGKAGFSGDGGAAVLAQLNSPAGLAMDPAGLLYIADSGNNRIREVARGIISTLMTVTGPTGLAEDASGNLYIAAVEYFGTQFQALGGVSSAFDVAVDAAGNPYFTAGAQVNKLTLGGKTTLVAGSGAPFYFGGYGGPATSARLHSPAALAQDAAGNWYIADAGNNRIRRITPAGVIATVAGNGTAGSAGDNGPAVNAELNNPRGLVLDSSGNLYIADAGNNRIRKLSVSGILTTDLAGLNDPEAVAIDGSGNLVVADTGNNRLLRALPGGAATVIATVVAPVSVAFDSSGNLWVASSNSIGEIAGATLSTIAFSLSAPRALTFDANGNLLLAESGASDIRAIAVSGAISTLAGIGAAGFSGDGGPATSAALEAPAGLAVGASGTIWIADTGNNRIRMLAAQVTLASAPSAITVVNAATLAQGPVAPSEIVTIYGSGFAPGQTQLLFDGQPTTVFYSGAQQINALAPATLVPGIPTAIVVASNGATVASGSSSVVGASPGIFTLAGGTGQAAALDQDGSLNSASNPAARGSVVTFFATGQGAGVSAVSLTIGDYPATLYYAGPAPGFVGLMQINAQVPSGFAPAGVLNVVMTVGSATSQTGVSLVVN